MIRRYHLQLSFWLYSGMCVLVGSAAHTSGNNLLYWVFGAMLAGLLISGVVSGMMMMSVRATRLCPAHGAVGQPLIVRYAVTNRSRLLPAFNLHVEELAADQIPRRHGRWIVSRWFKRGAGADEPADGSIFHAGWEALMDRADAWVMHVAPHETAHGEAVFWPHRRGPAPFVALRLWTTFPFGIVRKSVTLRLASHTLIHPRVLELKRNVKQSILPKGPMGTLFAARAGSGDEFFGVREYRPGESMRHIAWKRAAGLDQIVCIERSQASPPKLRVILNLSQPTNQLHVDRNERVSPRELEERAISLAASFLHAATAEGFEVGLSVMGFDLPPAPVRRNQWHVQKMMASLAGLDLNRARVPAAPPGPADAERAAHIVIHPDRVDPTLGHRDAWHLTARQLESLVGGPITGTATTTASTEDSSTKFAPLRQAWSRLRGRRQEAAA